MKAKSLVVWATRDQYVPYGGNTVHISDEVQLWNDKPVREKRTYEAPRHFVWDAHPDSGCEIGTPSIPVKMFKAWVGEVPSIRTAMRITLKATITPLKKKETRRATNNS